MKRQTVKLLITGGKGEGLGYCCQFAFFSLFRQTSQIARRLGVTPRAIRYTKATMDRGELKCEGCTKCMKALLPPLR